MRVLAIESSCDECSAAVVKDGALLAVETRTQTVHQPFGGVVPELAGRSHVELVDGVVRNVAASTESSLRECDLIAATTGPGLVGSLLVGVNYARGLAQGLGVPFRGVHHLEAHLWSAEIEAGPLPSPCLVLLTSGGHTMLVRVNGLRDYRVLGETLDDALGEAYDKVGKLMGLSFPAGAEVDRLAEHGNAAWFPFPVSMSGESCDVSYSGLKTAVAYRVRNMTESERRGCCGDLLASFQEAALTTVLQKVRRAVEIARPAAVVAAGGVAANSQLRKRLVNLAGEFGVPCFLPPLRFCGDNAAMIGYLAWKLEAAGIRDDARSAVRPRWPLDALSARQSPR